MSLKKTKCMLLKYVRMHFSSPRKLQNPKDGYLSFISHGNEAIYMTLLITLFNLQRLTTMSDSVDLKLRNEVKRHGII